MPRDTRDDGFHEIQLNGKQLVFLFMAATVVSVVIFLCGVLVGRGAGTNPSTVASVAPATGELAEHSSAQVPVDGLGDVSAADGSGASVSDEPLDYFNRLEGVSPDEQLLSQPAEGRGPAQEVPEATVVSESAPGPPPVAAAPPAASNAEVPPAAVPAGDWAVQIAALNDSADAEVMARQWGEKGYPAYVVAPSSGTPAVYRVRIGAFQTRREADALAAKLQQEERISPWVTR